jgi:hypothetical protein
LKFFVKGRIRLLLRFLFHSAHDSSTAFTISRLWVVRQGNLNQLLTK